MVTSGAGTNTAVHVGWIGGELLDRDHLVSLGVKVGPYDRQRHCFEASVDEVAFRALGRFSGVYNWGLGLPGESRWAT